MTRRVLDTRDRPPSIFGTDDELTPAQRRYLRRAGRLATSRAKPTYRTKPEPATFGRRLVEERNRARSQGRLQTSGIGGISLDIAGNAVKEIGGIVTGLPKAGVKTSADFARGFAKGGIDQGIKEALVDPQVEYAKEKYGPLLPGGTPARESWERIKKEPVSTALDVFGVASAGVGAAGRATATARAASRGAGARGAYRAGKRIPEAEMRRLRSGAAEARPATSPNRLTRMVENRYDRFSEWLDTRDLAPILGAQRRVARAGARTLKQETKRARAEASRDINTIRGVGGPPATFRKIRSRAERTGLFWEAQLPEAARGGAGLRAVAADLKRTAAATPDPRARARLLVQARRAEAAAGKKYDPAALSAARRLMDERREILERAGKLNPDTAQQRTGLVARRVGMEADESTVYVGHRSKRSPKALERMGVVRNAGGKTKTPAGVGQRNEMRLYEQGRLRTDPDVIVEDWLAAQHYDFLNRSKDFLASLGEPIGPDGPNPGWFVVNRNGHKLPRAWKDIDPREAAIQAGFGDDMDAALFGDLSEYARNVVAKTGTPEAAELLQKSIPDDLVQVPPPVVERYFNELVGPQGARGRLKYAAEGTDAAMDMVRLGLLYTNPGYIPANLAGNSVMLLAAQGAYAPGNVRRAVTMLADPDLQRRIRAETGMGPNVSIASAGKNPVSRGTRALAQAAGFLADDILRAGAWFHEARKLGYRNKQQYKQLLSDPAKRADLDQVRSRVNATMVDFERVGPLERQTLGRVLFVWPWIRGAMVYPFRFAADFPVRTGIAVHAAEEANQEPDTLGPRPSYLDSAVPLGEREGDYQTILNPSAVNTPETLVDVGRALGSVKLDRATADTIGDMINPGIGALYDTLRGQVDYGTSVRKASVADAAKENLLGLVPAVKFAKELIDPSEQSDIYRQDRETVLRRRSRVLPYDVNVPEVNERGEREKRGSVPPGKRSYRDVFKERNDVFEGWKQHFPDDLEGGRLPKKAREAYNRKAQIKSARKQVERRFKEAGIDRDRAKLIAEAEIIARWGVITKGELAALKRRSPTLTEAQVEKYRRRINERVLEPAYLKLTRGMRDKLAERGVIVEDSS